MHDVSTKKEKEKRHKVRCNVKKKSEKKNAKQRKFIMKVAANE